MSLTRGTTSSWRRCCAASKFDTTDVTTTACIWTAFVCRYQAYSRSSDVVPRAKITMRSRPMMTNAAGQ
jgi:hypothetical protein